MKYELKRLGTKDDDLPLPFRFFPLPEVLLERSTTAADPETAWAFSYYPVALFLPCHA
jgi:hypothetical protein